MGLGKDKGMEVFSEAWGCLYRLPGSYGCLILNRLYPTGTEVSMPTQEDVVSILDEIRILGANTQKRGSDHEQINRLITWYSRRLTGSDADESNGNEPENRVALFAPIIRAYLSPCRSCKNCRYDCRGKSIYDFLFTSHTGYDQ